MYPVPLRFLESIRRPHAIRVRVEVWRGGVRVDPYGDKGLPVYGGNVDVDPGKQVRRLLAGVTVDATDEMWDLLSPVGTELRAYRGFTYLNGESDVVPIGRFVVPNLSETYGGDWSGQVGTASDRMILVQRARFERPRSIPAGTRVVNAIVTLLSEVLGEVTNLSNSTTVTASPLLFDRDRGGAITDLAASAAVDVFCAPDGTPTIRDVPQLADTSVWTVDPGDGGVLYKGTRDRTYSRSYSGVQVIPAQIDGATPFDPVTVWDDNPLSPTYRRGPFGEVLYYLTLPTVENTTQAHNAATAMLPKVTAPHAQLSVEAECNPALADGDTITVVLPPRQRGGRTVTERHLVGPFNVPLTPDGVQRIETASTSADLPDSE